MIMGDSNLLQVYLLSIDFLGCGTPEVDAQETMVITLAIGQLFSLYSRIHLF